MGRGCRQGDPILPYLFVLAAEFLSEAIRTNTKIVGIKIFEQEHKISQYADDTSLFLKPLESALRESMLVLSEFQSISGLKVNNEKTKVIKIGEWTQKIDCLGVSYDVDKFDTISDQNVEKKIIDIKKIINLWNARYLTPLGKVTIIKSLLISKITHVLLSHPTPSTYILNKLNIIFKNFIWKGKTPKF